MVYLIVQMWLLLVLAALLGGLCAWWLRSLRLQSQTRAWRDERDGALRDLNAARAAETRIASQLRLVQDEQSRSESHAMELREYRAKAAACEAQLREAQGEIAALRAQGASQEGRGLETVSAARAHAAETALAAAQGQIDALRLELRDARGAGSALDAAHGEISRLRGELSLTSAGQPDQGADQGGRARLGWRLRYLEARARFLERHLEVVGAGLVQASQAPTSPPPGGDGPAAQADSLAALRLRLAEARADGREAAQLRDELVRLRAAGLQVRELRTEGAQLEWKARYLGARVAHLESLHEMRSRLDSEAAGREAEREAERDAARALAAQLEIRLAEHEGEAAELASLRARIAAMPPPIVRDRAAEEALARRVAQLEAQTRTQAGDAITLSVLRGRVEEMEREAGRAVVCLVSEPDTGSETARLRWRNRYLDSRLRYLEGRMESEGAALDAVARATTMSERAADQAGLVRDLAEIDRMRARLAEIDTPRPVPPGIDDEEMDRLRWRVKYLEGRVRFLEAAPPPAPLAPAGVASESLATASLATASLATASLAPGQTTAPAPAPVMTPAPRPLPRTGPIMRAPAEVQEDNPDDGRTIEPLIEEVRPPTLAGPRDSVADDLKMIGGVGPKIETTLNNLGIYHFDQIAAWSPANAAWVEGYISFKGRVVRERWVEQARILARGGVTEAAEKYRRGEHT